MQSRSHARAIPQLLPAQFANFRLSMKPPWVQIFLHSFEEIGRLRRLPILAVAVLGVQVRIVDCYRLGRLGSLAVDALITLALR